MDDELKDRLTSRNLWTRALYMIFFAIAYSVARIVLTLLVIFQFITILFTGSGNRPLLKLGHNLATYIYQVIQFQTFNSEDKPFPFSDWPDTEPEDSQWLDTGEPVEETTAEPSMDAPVREPEPVADPAASTGDDRDPTEDLSGDDDSLRR